MQWLLVHLHETATFNLSGTPVVGSLLEFTLKVSYQLPGMSGDLHLTTAVDMVCKWK